MSERQKLEIGAGENPTPGYHHLDIRQLDHIETVCDARELPFADESWDEIKAWHILEHIPYRDTLKTLREWYRVLKKGGILDLKVPDTNQIILKWVRHEWDWEKVVYHLAGGQEYEDNTHKAFFIPAYLRLLLFQAGFTIISESNDRTEIEIHLIARKT